MRTVNSDALALLARIKAGERIPVVQLVELRFDTVLYLTTAGRELVWGGHTWSPAGLGPIEAIEGSATEMPDVRLTLPAVSDAQKAVALEPGIEGVVCVIYDALVDPVTAVVEDAVQAWKGSLSVPTMVDGDGGAALSVTAEHRGMYALRAKPSRYTNDEQQRLHPGDECFDFDPETDAAPLAWPAASFFKQ